MFSIKCAFDQELGPDGIDPLGSITLADDESQISIENTYLDSWLAALLDVPGRISKNRNVSVEAPEEPKPINILAQDDGSLVIGYKHHKVTAKNIQEFLFALKSAVGTFLKQLDSCPNQWRNDSIVPIRRFWATNQN